MSMDLLKKHLKESGNEYYKEVVAEHNRTKESMDKEKKASLLSAASLKKK